MESLRSRRTRWIGVAVGLWGLVSLGSCASDTPGPPFEMHPAPVTGSTVTVYRIDRIPSPGRARVRLGGGREARLANGEYAWFRLPPGRHVAKIQFRGLPWAWGWDDLPFHAQAGEQLFLRLQADGQRTNERAGHLETDFPGPRNERFGVALFRGFVSREVALEQLPSTRLSPDQVGDE